MAKNRNWTQEEIEYLEDNYGKYTMKTLMQNLDRTASAIANKVNRLGLGRWYSCQGKITLGEFSKATGITLSTLMNWMKMHDLPVYSKKMRETKFYFINIYKWWKWAATHRQMVEWDKIDRLAIGPEPFWVAESRKAKVVDSDYSQKKIPWSKAEDEKLKWMLKQYKFTYPYISKELNRTHGAIKRRMSDLNLKMRPIPMPTKKVYSEEEVQEILNLYNSGYGFKFIARKLNRSEAGVRGKIERMGYTFSNRVLVKSEAE